MRRCCAASGVPKGDAIAVARIAGIQAAKRTPDLVPLCHPIAIHGVTVDLEVHDDHVAITRRPCAPPTAPAWRWRRSPASPSRALALVDMVKALDPAAVITDVRVEEKLGGKTGEWRRPAGARRLRALVVAISTRAATGVYDDRTGPGDRRGASQALGFDVDGPHRGARRPGDRERSCSRRVHDGFDVVVTTGGTGLSPTDVTPEHTSTVITTRGAGIAEAIRAAGLARGVPTAALSRGRRRDRGPGHAHRQPPRLARAG